MLFLIFIILIGASLYIVYDSKNKNLQQRRQILVLKKQNNNLKNKAEEKNIQSEKLTVKYYKPQNETGKIIESCPLHLAPLAASHVLANISPDTTLKLIDCAEISGTIWYEVLLDSEEGFNNKGWVKSNNIVSNGSI